MAQSSVQLSNILVEAGTNELEVITFYLQWIDPVSGQPTRAYYGINAAKVRELVAMPEKVTEMPDCPKGVEGVFLLRDRTITLTDLCQWFHYDPDSSDAAKATWVVIVAEINGKPFGFICHGVDKVHRVSWTNIQSPPDMLARYQSITGVCLVNNQIIQMVDFERIVAAIDPTMMLEEPQTKERDEAVDFSKAVVIADDSTTIRTQMRRALEGAGFRVSAHHDGQVAWDYLESLRAAGTVDDEILAVITDIEMPRMDGHHLCLKIKEQQAFRNIPVILFSSMISPALRNKGVAVGADDQITKPELSTLVDRLFAAILAKHS